jgi:phosphoglycolate phosphatase-like HAD superfamily hydrolase
VLEGWRYWVFDLDGTQPEPDGIHTLLERWSAPPRESVVVGDSRSDLQAGHAAGVTTLYVDPDGDFPFAEHADHVFADLVELRERLRP